MKFYSNSFFYVFILWPLLCFLFKKDDANVDGYDEIGLPFIFYRRFYGKCIECRKVGFFFFNLLYDLLLLMFISYIPTLIKKMLSSKKSKKYK